MAEPAMIMVDTSSVFMCKQCNVILAEGRDASEYCEQLNVIACLRATAAVRVDKEVNYHLSAEMQNCVHTRLICKICSTNVGLFLTTAVSEFAHLREMFCFWRTAIVCYSMETGQLVEGSQINVNVSQCVTELKNLEEETCNIYKSIMELSKLLLD